MADLVASKVDLAVQITSAPLDDLVATRLCDVRWNFVATPACLQALEQSLGRPLRAPADLLQARLILPLAMGGRLAWLTGSGDDGVSAALDVLPSLQSGDYRLLYDAVLDGLGLALLPDYVTSAALAGGTLVAVLDQVGVLRPGQCHVPGAHARPPAHHGGPRLPAVPARGHRHRRAQLAGGRRRGGRGPVFLGRPNSRQTPA